MATLRRLPAAASICASLLGSLALAACGEEGEEVVDQDALRECLAGAELEIEPPQATAGAGLGNVSPDFRAVTADGIAVDLIVQKNEGKARRSAADIRAALLSFGAAGSEVVSRRNAIAVIDGEIPEAELSAIEDCLGGA
jgi:hypothetical protein